MKIEISKKFRTQALKAVFSVVLFLIVYFIILLIAIQLITTCLIGGVALIVMKPGLFTLMLGIGLASLGFFILVFFVKFIFKKHIVDRSHLTEITKVMEPKLFEFIGEIVKEVGTDFPKKIYLSNDVNASVFYDSSFWSMFFPIKKNLMIGLGLVNTVSVQELKAVIAHEFGHFSQRSMKVGSYVYNVNQVIYNMLYDNDSFDNSLNKWASLHGSFSVFGMLATKIISVVQWILKKMYDLVNISYLALSREMEFHADEVAANVAGSKSLSDVLVRLELAASAYNSVLRYYGHKIIDKVKSKNIFAEQTFVFNYQAKVNGFEMVNGLPNITILDIKKYNKSKLNIQDQWSSHPTNEERIANLNRINISKKYIPFNLANTLFKDIDEVMRLATNKVFSQIEGVEFFSELELSSFIKEYCEDIENNSFESIYNGYYDNKNPITIPLNTSEVAAADHNIESLFGHDKVKLVYELISLQNDKEALMNLRTNPNGSKTFDYNGTKYKITEIDKLISVIDKDISSFTDHIRENDANIYQYFLRLAIKQSLRSTLIDKYEKLFKYESEFDQKSLLFNKLMSDISFVSVVTPTNEIYLNLGALKGVELKLKAEISSFLGDVQLQGEISEEMKDVFDKYLNNELTYFANEKYLDGNLNIFNKVIQDYGFLILRKYFLLKKELLTFQCELLEIPYV